MQISESNRCQFCGQLFCCRKCRENHALLEHEKLYRSDCALCNNTHFVLFENRNLITHISAYHLPLACVRCGALVRTESELTELDEKCILVPGKDMEPLDFQTAATVAVPNTKEAATNTMSPTPNSNIKMNWITQMAYSNNNSNAPLFQCTSTVVTSTANTTAVFSSRGIIRSTSTPTQQELMCVFVNASSLQVSSICNQSEQTSPAGLAMGLTPMAPKVENNKFKLPLHRKLREKHLGTTNSHTPLRQQALSYNAQRVLMQRDIRLLFHGEKGRLSMCLSPGSNPLDLRMSPAIRRSSAGDCNRIHPISLMHTSSVKEVPEEDEPIDVDALYPETPPPKPKSSTRLDVPSKHSDSCIFYTPIQDYSRSRPTDCLNTGEEECKVDTIIDTMPETRKGSLWKVLASVIRFASFSLIPKLDPVDEVEKTESINIKRRRPPPSPIVKSHPASPSSPTSPVSPVNPIKRTRIQGRPPIARMRVHHESFD